MTDEENSLIDPEDYVESEYTDALTNVAVRQLLPAVLVIFTILFIDGATVVLAVIGAAYIPNILLRWLLLATMTVLACVFVYRFGKANEKRKAEDAANVRTDEEAIAAGIAAINDAEKARTLTWSHIRHVVFLHMPFCLLAVYALAHWMPLVVAGIAGGFAVILDLLSSVVVKPATKRMQPFLGFMAGGEKRTWEI